MYIGLVALPQDSVSKKPTKPITLEFINRSHIFFDNDTRGSVLILGKYIGM